MCGLMRDPARLSGSVGVGLRPDIMLIGLACVIGLTALIAIAWALRARKLNENRTIRDYLQRIASREDADEAFPHSGATSQAVSANHGRARPPIQYFIVLVMVNLMWAFQFSGIPRCQPCDETITRFWHLSTSGKNPRT